MGGQSERKEKDTAADKKPSLLVCFFFLMLIENGDSLATGVCALSSVCFSLSYREHTQPQMRKDTWRHLKHTYTHTLAVERLQSGRRGIQLRRGDTGIEKQTLLRAHSGRGTCAFVCALKVYMIQYSNKLLTDRCIPNKLFSKRRSLQCIGSYSIYAIQFELEFILPTNEGNSFDLRLCKRRRCIW